MANSTRPLSGPRKSVLNDSTNVGPSAFTERLERATITGRYRTDWAVVMIVLDVANLEHWTPDFSTSEQQNPDWVRLRFHDQLLCNSLSWVDWSTNPVQVEICDQCGVTGCTSGGYVQVSQLGDLIFWTQPILSVDDDRATSEYEASSGIKHFGAIAIPVALWNQWRHETTLPEATDLPAMTGNDLVQLWLAGIPTSLRCTVVGDVLPMLHRTLLAADTLDIDMAVHTVERVIDRMRGWMKRPVVGAIKSAKIANARVESLYCDGPRVEEWPAIASLGQDYVPALSREWITVLDPAP